MTLIRASYRRAFTLIELLVCIAIVVVCFLLAFPAVQKVRELMASITCRNNLKELTIAVHNFEHLNHRIPTYFGVDPPSYFNEGKSPTYPGGSGVRTPYGGWFIQLLPYVEQESVHKAIAQEISASGKNHPDWYVLPFQVPVPGTGQPTEYNGHAYSGPTKGVGEVGTGPGPNPHGIWIDGVHDAMFKGLQCPSDPSAGQSAPPGWVYDGFWGSTSYAANWNSWTLPVGYNDLGGQLWAGPPSFEQIQDGLSVTVLFAEVYQYCDTVGRIALFPWFYHSFGLDWYANYDENHKPYENTTKYGTFQVRPLPRDHDSCPPDKQCCNNWVAQTPHQEMNVAMMDGSVRSVSKKISPETWRLVLLPRDGQEVGKDWKE